MPYPVVLASSSPYRRTLVDRLAIPYEWSPANIDETPLPGESPRQLARRLSLEKARALAPAYPDHLIIGSDQVAASADTLLGKPGNFETAARQLRLVSGKSVNFYTSVTLLNSKTATFNTYTDTTRVYFRQLTDGEIRTYLEKEQPYDCAGSFKVEGLGIALFKRIDNSDPTALVGLPLIKLTAMLRDTGVDILQE